MHLGVYTCYYGKCSSGTVTTKIKTFLLLAIYKGLISCVTV